MDNRPGNELKERKRHLETDYHPVPLLLPAVKKKQNEHRSNSKKRTLIMEHVIVNWAGTAIGWWTEQIKKQR